MRKFPLGQDRYARQYWVLPNMGGVIVEGVETSLDKNLQVNLDFVDLSTGVVQSGDVSENVGVASVVENVESDRMIDVTGDSSTDSIDLTQDRSNQVAKDDTSEKMESESSLNTSNRDSGLRTEHNVDLKPPSTEARHHMISDDVIASQCSNSGPTEVVDSSPGYPQKPAQQIQHTTVDSNSVEITDSGRPTTAVISDNSVTKTPEGSYESLETVKSKNLTLQQGTMQETPYSRNSFVPRTSNQLSTLQDSRLETNTVDILPTDTGNVSNKTSFAQRQEQSETQQNITYENNLPPLLSGTIEQRSQGVARQEIKQPEACIHTSLSCSESLEEEEEVKNEEHISHQRPTEPGLSTEQTSNSVHSHLEIEQGRITTENSKPWFSICPRSPCETTRLAYVNNQTVIGSGLIQPQQQVVTAAPTQQQYIMAGPSAQYAYMTPDGQVVSATGGQTMIQQVGIGYGLIGNTLVQVPQTQYVAVDSSGGVIGNFIGQQNPSVQYAVTQTEGGGVQYVALGDSGGTGYVTVGGTGGQSTIMQAVNREGGGQMLVQVMQNERGQMVIPVDGKTQQVVSYTGEQNQLVQVGVVNSDSVPAETKTKEADAGVLAKGVVKMETERPISDTIGDAHPSRTEVKLQIAPHHVKEEDEIPGVPQHLDRSSPYGTLSRSGPSDRSSPSRSGPSDRSSPSRSGPSDRSSPSRSGPSDTPTVDSQHERAANSVAVQDGTLVQHSGSSNVQSMSSEALGSHGDSSPPHQTQVVQDSQVS